jgi:hypothetical protein
MHIYTLLPKVRSDALSAPLLLLLAAIARSSLPSKPTLDLDGNIKSATPNPKTRVPPRGTAANHTDVAARRLSVPRRPLENCVGAAP